MSERLKRKGRERRSKKVRSRRSQEELRWGLGRDSCRGSEDEGWSRTDGGTPYLLRLEEKE